MNLKGKQTYTASAQQIWDILMDTEKLAKITPGVSKLESTGEDQYNAISDIKIGPVKGSFKGDLFLENKEEPAGFTLRVKQLSKIGNADATVNIQINELDGGQCELAFDGKAKLSGTLARTGQRVLGGVANTLTKQFFAALETELAETNSSLPLTTNVNENKSAALSQEVVAQVVKEKASVLSEMQKETSKAAVKESQTFSFWQWLKELFGMK